MELHYNVTGTERKALVNTIGKTLGIKPKYLGMPSASFQIGDFTVTKDGTLLFENGTDATEITSALKDAGYDFEVPIPENDEQADLSENTKPETKNEEADSVELTVEMPLDKVAVGNLTKLLEAKGSLIKKALGIDSLEFEIRDDRIAFPWFPEVTPDEAQAYTKFIAALCKMAKEATRVTATEKAVDNEKYAFRCFLLRLGFIGNEYKQDRKILLKNLTGSSAFRNGARKGGKEE